MPPTALLESLQGIRRRVKFLAIGFGSGMVTASAVLLLIAVILLDYIAVLPVPARLSLLIAAAALLTFACIRWIVRPAMARVTLSDVAGRLEHTFPQFDDRLRSTIDFVRDDLPGSTLMKERVVSQATAMATEVDLGRVVLVRPVWYAAVLLPDRYCSLSYWVFWSDVRTWALHEPAHTWIATVAENRADRS